MICPFDRPSSISARSIPLVLWGTVGPERTILELNRFNLPLGPSAYSDGGAQSGPTHPPVSEFH
jgi:hypothetical protein